MIESESIDNGGFKAKTQCGRLSQRVLMNFKHDLKHIPFTIVRGKTFMIFRLVGVCLLARRNYVSSQCPNATETRDIPIRQNGSVLIQNA